VWYYLILILSINEYLQHRFPVSSEHLWNLLGQLEQGWSTMKGLSPIITLERNYYKFQEEFEDTKWVIRIRISMKNRQNNGQKIPNG
jgi:hypothetical protein